MSVYVGMGIADKPRVQHLPKPILNDWESQQLSLCRRVVMTAEDHDRQRRHYGFRKPLTVIDYEHLPVCKFCERIS